MAYLEVNIKGVLGAPYHYQIKFPIGEISGVFGPTGSGKTTLLRFISGLNTPDEGIVSFDKNEWFSLKENWQPSQRNLSFVFQKGGLLSHFTVQKNIQFTAAPDVDINEIMQWCKVTHLRSKFPSSLSGGQQQQVALARAMAQNNSLMLLDEPFSAMHKNLQLDIQQALLNYHKKYRPTILLVSHSKSIMLSLAQRVAIISNQTGNSVQPVTQVFSNTKNITELLGEVYQLDIEKNTVWIKVEGQLVAVSISSEQFAHYHVGQQVNVPVSL